VKGNQRRNEADFCIKYTIEGINNFSQSRMRTFSVYAQVYIKESIYYLEFVHDGQRIVHLGGGHLQDQFVLHIQHNLPGLAVAADQIMQGVAVGHPGDQPSRGTERHDTVALDAEVSLVGRHSAGIVRQKGVDQAEQLHGALVLTQIFVTLQERNTMNRKCS